MQPEFLEIWERFFNDDEGKDVWLKASDGVVPAHSVFLAQLSEPLKAMLRGPMREAQTKEIEMPDYTSAQLRFIMRLAYTGHTDITDWKDIASEEAPSPPLASPIPQRPSTPIAKERKRRRSNSRGAGLRRRSRSRRASPPSSCEENKKKQNKKTCVDKPPLQLLFGCTSFAKKYDINGFCSMLLEKIKPRLDVSNFEEIMRFAIDLDISPLKLFAVRFAEGEDRIRHKYEKNELSAEVMFELQALWGKPLSQKRHTRKPF